MDQDLIPSMDFETYSEAGYVLDYTTGTRKGKGLSHCGLAVYAEHPSTEIKCLYYDMKDGHGPRPWLPGTPNPKPLLEHVAAGLPVKAFNITFEWYMWNSICTNVFGWPLLLIDQCYCDMAEARRHNMPGNLDQLCQVLGTHPKDKRGKALIKLLCMPNKWTKKDPLFKKTPVTHWDLHTELYKYCKDDVKAEDGASAMLPNMTEYERRTWLTDQRINQRGINVDMKSLHKCLAILEEATELYTNELRTLTKGQVNGVAEVAKLKDWCNENSYCNLPDMTVETVDGALENESLPAGHPVRRALEIRSILAGANVKKLISLKRQVSCDGRLREQYVYCGAQQTGRFASWGVQLQNISSKGPDSKTCDSCSRHVGVCCTECPYCWSLEFTPVVEWSIHGVMWALHDINHYDFNMLLTIWGDPGMLLTGCLRGLFKAKDGHTFVCSDFSAIEAMIAACISKCQWRIDIFRTHGLIYEQSAANATGVPFEEIVEYKKIHKVNHPHRKKIGKVRELANGYGGWVNANKNFGAGNFMTDDEIKADVLKWRAESPEIVEMWGDQFRHVGPGKWDYTPELFGLEGCAISAIKDPGNCYSWKGIGYVVRNNTLHCRLPSGRFLYYHQPKLMDCEDKLSRGLAVKITFMAYKKQGGWKPSSTYGGRLFENVVQAIAADIQAEAMCRVEDAGHRIVMHTHDELTVEVPTGSVTVDEISRIMSECPHWCADWPIKAAGWTHDRYQKD